MIMVISFMKFRFFISNTSGLNRTNVKFQNIFGFWNRKLYFYRGNNNGKITELYLIQITSKYQKQAVLKPCIFYIEGKIDTNK